MAKKTSKPRRPNRKRQVVRDGGHPALARLQIEQKHLRDKVLNVRILAHPRGDNLSRIYQAVDVVNTLQSYFRLQLDVRAGAQLLSEKKGDVRSAVLRKRLLKEFSEELVIAIVEQDLKDGYTMSEYPGCTIISCDDWPLSSDTPSMRVYCVYQLTAALVSFAACLTTEENISLMHDDENEEDYEEEGGPRGCLFDVWQGGRGLYMSMVGARLCDDCRSALSAHGMPPEAELALERLLDWIRSVVLGRERPLPRDIFIGHGHHGDWKKLKAMLEKWGLRVSEFNQVPVAGVSVGQRLKAMLDESRFAFLVMTGEDETNAGVLRARLNVIHEIGLFQGRLGAESAIVVRSGKAEVFSNIDGLSRIDYEDGNIGALAPEIHRLLIDRGMLAGDIDISGPTDAQRRRTAPARARSARNRPVPARIPRPRSPSPRPAGRSRAAGRS
jgi:hypothetical protein